MSHPRTEQVLQAARAIMEQARAASREVYENDPLFSPARGVLSTVETMIAQMERLMQSINDTPDAEGVEQALDTLEQSTVTLATVVTRMRPGTPPDA
ncbi:MAG TPA: hypothetical protein VK447_17955 [Myxococcaceae bacterium]|nr:hypothetical protein [Myxococcaceae bacterium]